MKTPSFFYILYFIIGTSTFAFDRIAIAEDYPIEEVEMADTVGNMSTDTVDDPILNELVPVASANNGSAPSPQALSSSAQRSEPSAKKSSDVNLSSETINSVSDDSIKTRQADANAKRSQQESEYQQVRSQVVATQLGRDAALARLKKSLEEIEVRKKELSVMRTNLAKLQEERNHARESAEVAEQKAIELKAEQAVLNESKSSLQAEINKQSDRDGSISKMVSSKVAKRLPSKKLAKSDVDAEDVEAVDPKIAKKLAKKNFLKNRDAVERNVASVDRPIVDEPEEISGAVETSLTLRRDCNVRQKASTASGLVQIYEKGAVLQGSKISANWWKVRDEQGKSGFLAQFCLK